MAFTRDWDNAYETSPSDGQNISQGATRIRELKVDVRERINVDHLMPGTTTAEGGMHRQVTFVDPLGAKPTQANDQTYLYTKDASGTSELFWEDEAGNELQLTTAGELNIPAPLVYSGKVNASGTLSDGPAGWGCSRILEGVFRVTHTVDATMNVTTSPDAAGSIIYTSEVDTIGASSFDVWVKDSGGTADWGFMFVAHKNP